VTGGSDNFVKVWNLLPAISIRYEKGPLLYPGAVPEKTVAEDSKMEDDNNEVN